MEDNTKTMEYSDILNGVMNLKISGFFSNIPEGVYHQVPALSQSSLKEMAISPKHCKQMMNQPRDEDPSFGTLSHLAVLQPNLFESSVVGVGDRRTKAGKEEAERAEREGKRICTLREYDKVRSLQREVKSNKFLSSYLDRADKEVCAIYSSEEDKLAFKGRFDGLIRNEDIILDLKTISRGMGKNPHALDKLISIRNWHLQAWWYSHIHKLITGRKARFLNLFVEDTEPYDSFVAEMSEAAIEKAQEIYLPLVTTYAQCLYSGEWPGYAPEIKQVSLPGYVWSQDEAITGYDEEQLGG